MNENKSPGRPPIVKKIRQLAKQSRHLVALFMVLGFGLNARESSAEDVSVYGVFVGSNPCGKPIRQALEIPAASESDLMQCKLTLYQDSKTLAPSRYQLRCQYGSTAAGRSGLGKAAKTLERQGTWTIRKGIKSDPDASVYELNGAVSLFQVDANVLQLLNPDRSLMIGTDGGSYTLNRTEHSEKPPARIWGLFRREMSYHILPLATGAAVFGVFEGRSPCRGIARELAIPVSGGCLKTKWRVTLYQNPKTLEPTTYQVEGSLYGRGARNGDWAVVRGTPKNPNAIVYRLARADTEPALLLLKGDDNVLFFLDHNRNPLVGHTDFSYTLNRRMASP